MSSAIGKDTPTRPVDTPEGSAAGDEGHGQSSAKYPAVKDRKCQYCHQAFTSSSLGRHLDQFLFKKKPDGVHDVEEIRRLRSGITRRQARTSSTKRDNLERSTGKGQPDSPASAREGRRASRDGVRMMFNTPTWHATGVINDIPNPNRTREFAGSYRPSVSQSAASITLPDYANRSSDTASQDTLRSLELALREVLDNIKAAASTSLRPRLSPFDFEIQSQTFPSLCLQLLPAPPTLFSTHPFPSPSSFPLQPPGPEHLEIVRQALRSRIQQWLSDQLAVDASSASQSGQAGIGLDANMINRSAQQHEDMSSRHLDLSFNHWMSLSPEARRNQWQLEITRAFVREAEKRKSSDEQLARVQQEANQLRAQVVKLGSCQWPREFALFPPDFLPLPRDVIRELDAKESQASPNSARWDYDNLVAKWKRVVMHNKSMGRIGVGHSNVLADENNPDNTRGRGDDSTNRSTAPASTANRAKTAQPPANVSPEHTGASSAFAPSNTTPPLTYQNVHQSPRAGPPAKRPRLMNGNLNSNHNNHGVDGVDGENVPPGNSMSTSTSQNPAGMSSA
ncbi:hypothetical protein MPDQ_002013 [Monascus purpureus]|uniref:Uncharacterized protein n=1 Tax=Monascus purpureus TaxID=5098 RepID=A0A507R4D8_MONPU|nr:hypothetical protein MPDQ_002013 [Monascus purpureus]BDD56333.1 hypothetical protein MAP00_001803 [Monascus purpureus]